jgi:hypothetical protein
MLSVNLFRYQKGVYYIGTKLFSNFSFAVGSFSMQWVLGALSPEVKQPGMKLTIHLRLVTRLRMCAAISSVPCMPPWSGAYFNITQLCLISVLTSTEDPEIF